MAEQKERLRRSFCRCTDTSCHLAGPSCHDSPTPWQEGWRGLEKLYSEGAVRAIGVSNFSEGLLRDLLLMATVVPAAVQNWMDPFHQDEAVRALCAEHGENSRSRTADKRNPRSIFEGAGGSFRMRLRPLLASLSSHDANMHGSTSLCVGCTNSPIG